MVAAQNVESFGGMKKPFLHRFRHPPLSFKGGGSGAVVLLHGASAAQVLLLHGGSAVLGRQGLIIVTFHVLSNHDCPP